MPRASKKDILKLHHSLERPVQQSANSHLSFSQLTIADAGKSTLAKSLIEFAEYRNSTSPLTFPSPVVGSRETSDPTSVDVRMYADPDTFRSTKPLLYADCEGLHGGEQLPRAGRPGYRRQAIGRTWFLEWANTDEKRRRSYTVSQLYPRLLYAFSDVVIFVTTNRR